MDPEALGLSEPESQGVARTRFAGTSQQDPFVVRHDSSIRGIKLKQKSSDTEGMQMQFRRHQNGIPEKTSSDTEGLQMEFRRYSGGIPMKFWVFRFWGRKKHHVRVGVYPRKRPRVSLL